MCAELVPTSVLALDVPEPVGGWPGVVEDDVGRPSVPREVARSLLAEHREAEARAFRHRQEIEERLIEADAVRRSQIPPGIPLDAVPAGVSPGEWLMLSDPEAQSGRRESVVEHALQRRDGAVYHPLPRNEP
jgi:hypothetical protein